MWIYEKKLQFPVNVTSKDLGMAKILLAQYGGPASELSACLQYLNQRYIMPTGQTKALLTDIGTEEIGHLEMIGTMVYQIMQNATVAELKEAGLELERKVGWKRTRKGIARFADKTVEEKDALIALDPLYGKIICRCEQVTESEILQAIHRPVGAKTLDAVKRRVRAGMGRCQSGFCSPHVIEILARELNVPMNEITKFGGQSKIMYHKTK